MAKKIKIKIKDNKHSLHLNESDMCRLSELISILNRNVRYGVIQINEKDREFLNKLEKEFFNYYIPF